MIVTSADATGAPSRVVTRPSRALAEAAIRARRVATPDVVAEFMKDPVEEREGKKGSVDAASSYYQC